MKQIYANNFTTLSLGRQGENLARQVVFDIQDLESLYGSGTVEVIYQRPGDELPYPLAVRMDGTIVTWDVTATDTEMSDGYGKCELRYYVGETLAKSKTWRTWVDHALQTPSETAPPDPEQGWVDQVLAAGAAAKASADAAKADADRAAALAAEVSKKAAQTEKDAVQSAQAKEAAQTAQRLAEEAQSAAEAARTAAAAAQAAAETAATDAAGAKQDAETAQKAAHDAAAAAANTLESIQTLYQEMQTWAQGVIQDVNAAGSIAVQSVQSAGDTQVQRVTDEGTTQTANAKAQADAAAQSAADAAQSAQEAAESAAVYDGVVSDVNQLKQDIADITPDDTTVDGKPWTSKKIVDTICQPFEESGNPVQVYPVEHYPLGVKVQIEPKQKGSGDPSPDNIRPITGRDKVSVTRCGKNLVCSKYDPGYTETENGLTFTVNDDYSVSVSGTATIETYFNFKAIKHKTINAIINAMDKTVKINGYTARDLAVQTYLNGNTALYLVITKGQTVDRTYYPIMVYGDEVAYEPYTGSTTDIALPETVYGGTLDVETGVVTVSKRITIADGTVNKFTPSTSGEFWNMNRNSAPGIADVNNVENSHFIGQKFGGNKNFSFIYTTPIFMEGLFNTADDLNAYLVEQNTAGTPVTFVYKLQNPYTIQLSPQQITALSGVNTIYTNADGVIVTGAEDPKHTITELKNAIISLGGNV